MSQTEVTKDLSEMTEEDLLCDIAWIEANRNRRDLTEEEIDQLVNLYTRLDEVRE